jgi:hypothetical protein
LLGTKIPLPNTDDAPITQNFTVGDVAAFANTYSLGYTEYTGIISQAGTAAPTVTVLKNSIAGTMTWARTGAGVYTITSNGTPFTALKTVVFLNVGDGEPNQILMWTRTSSSVITLKTNGSDGRITAGGLEIRVYS